MSATLTVPTDAAISTAIVDALRASQWNDGTAFEVVERFDSTEIERAFSQILVAHRSRVAFVVLYGESWESPNPGLLRQSLRSTRVALLISDRVLGDRSAAIFGGPSNPGCLALKDVAIAAVCGPLISNPAGCDVQPVSVDLMFVERVEESSTKLPGRAACLVELVVSGGSLHFNRSKGPH